MLAAGQLKGSDLAWREGLSGWVALAGLEGVVLPAASPAATGFAADVAPAPAPAPAPVSAPAALVSAAAPVSAAAFQMMPAAATTAAATAAATATAAAAPASVYAPPRAAILQPAGFPSQVSPGTVLALRQTRPWVLFLAVLGIIVTVLMVLGGLFAMGVGGARIGNGDTTYMVGFLVAYLVIGLMYIYPIIKLFKYSSAIRRLTQSNSVRDLEAALGQQKSFWKFVGILALVLIVVYFIIFAVAGFGAFNAVKARSVPSRAFPAP